MTRQYPDPWLDRWLDLLKSRAGAKPVLEIGCGFGDDTAVLDGAGLSVIGFDLSAEAVAVTRARVPAARIGQQDVRDPLPAGSVQLGAIVASLSLHYFSWKDTIGIVERIRHALRPGGILLCRLNSTQDTHFGADSAELIEPGYFLVQGEAKRFFDEAAVARLFGEGWNVLGREHRTTDKYHLPKSVWEIVVERVS
ncbi:MAG: class I SAM-dependent methyltransferase [Herbaspirillum sp.]|nr:class I SAM-dependent methyltransferase [Herbaspirillum sp.]